MINLKKKPFFGAFHRPGTIYGSRVRVNLRIHCGWNVSGLLSGDPGLWYLSFKPAIRNPPADVTGRGSEKEGILPSLEKSMDTDLQRRSERRGCSKRFVGIQEPLSLEGGGFLELVRVVEDSVEQWEHYGVLWKELVQVSMSAHSEEHPQICFWYTGQKLPGLCGPGEQWGRENVTPGVSSPGFESQHCHFLGGCLASDFSLNFSITICKMGIIVASIQRSQRNGGNHLAHEHTVSTTTAGHRHVSCISRAEVQRRPFVFIPCTQQATYPSNIFILTTLHREG